MTFRVFVLVSVTLFVGIFLCSCSSPKQSKKALCIVGNDTLSIVDISTLVPDSLGLSEKVSRAALEIALAQEAKTPDADKTDKTLSQELANQLSLQTGFTWSPKASYRLFSAAKIVRKKFGEGSSAQAIAISIDSLFAHSVKLDTALHRKPASKDPLFARLTAKLSRQELESVLQSLFVISAKTANVLSDFLLSQDSNGTARSDVSKLIRGLVADTHHVEKKTVTQSTAAPVQNTQDAKLALKYRPQQIISDSIKKHIPNLEALYKKQLKIRPGMAGTIWVTFEISPDGSVASAKIKNTEISQREFLVPFSNYIQRIRFNAIPSAVGIMTFEFPFEFTPEN